MVSKWRVMFCKQTRTNSAIISSSSSREPSGEAGWWMAAASAEGVQPSMLHGDAHTLFVGLGAHDCGGGGAPVTVTLQF